MRARAAAGLHRPARRDRAGVQRTRDPAGRSTGPHRLAGCARPAAGDDDTAGRRPRRDARDAASGRRVRGDLPGRRPGRRPDLGDVRVRRRDAGRSSRRPRRRLARLAGRLRDRRTARSAAAGARGLRRRTPRRARPARRARRSGQPGRHGDLARRRPAAGTASAGARHLGGPRPPGGRQLPPRRPAADRPNRRPERPRCPWSRPRRRRRHDRHARPARPGLRAARRAGRSRRPACSAGSRTRWAHGRTSTPSRR